MSALDFPTPTEVGQVYIANGKTWVWDGVSWNNQTAGFSGSKGFTGSIGFTGSRGAGFTGSQGETGFAGSIGGIGFTGSIGIGFTGSRGDTGFVGSQGIIGFSGSQGTIGFTGSQGIQGLLGNTGYTGSQGTQGIQGVQGNIGYTGSQGIQGTIGFTGSQGIQGLQGTVGFTGSQGIQGIQGTIGYTGSQGIQGLQGTTGFTGSQGIQGVQGLVGEGVATGGVQYDLLQKSSSTDYDTEWTSTPTVDSLIFDTTTGSEVSQLGELLWDADAGTIDVLMNHGVVQNIGEDQYYLVQAAENISKGDVCIAVGTIGESGVILVARSVPVYQTQEIISQQIMGLAASDILQDERGYVQAFGQLRKIDTTAFQQGEILWADPTVAGGLTNTQPEAPNWKTIVALVVARHEEVGALQIRPTFGSSLANDELVHLPSLVDDGILRYNDANGRFELESLGTMADQNSDSVSITGGTVDATLTYDNTVSTLTSTDVKAAIDELDGKVGGLLSASDAMIFKGTLGTGATYTTLPTTYETGWTLKVTQAGTYAGQVAEVGDLYIALVDRSGSGNLDSDWTVVQTNIDGAVTGPGVSTDGSIAVFDGLTGSVIKNGGVNIADLGTMSSQDSDSVDITGGTLDNLSIDRSIINRTSIGATTPSTGAFTTLSANDDVNFDSGTLFVDASEDRVGIGTTSPVSPLHIQQSEFDSNDDGITLDATGQGSTRMYLAGSVFRIAKNSTDAFTIDNSQNVGIGTTSPSQRLDVAGIIRSAGDIILDQSNPRLDYDGGSSGALRFWSTSSGQERMRITSTGNLGIGTTAPSAQLEVSRSETNEFSTIRWSNKGASGRTYEIGLGGDTASAGFANNLYFYDSTASTTRMVIDSSGNVLVGKTTLDQWLNVGTKGIQASHTDWFVNGFTQYSNDTKYPILLLGKSRSGSIETLTYPSSGDRLGAVAFAGAQTNNSSFGGGSIISAIASENWSAGASGSSMEFETTPNGSNNPARRMIIDSGGNVGIATTSPSNKLTINGGLELTSSEFIGNGAGFYLPATNKLGFITSGNGQMFIDSSGNVGIGDASPNRKLEISDSSNPIIRFSRNTTLVNGNHIGFNEFYSNSLNYGLVGIWVENASTNASQFRVYTGSDGSVSDRMTITSTGDVLPGANGTQDLGSSTLRWNTVYTSDLSLKNDHGDWTIVEGEDDLFLYNNKKNKVYKFALTEVDPSIAPAKRD